MTNDRSLNHSKWAYQYHVVFIPKYRKKAIYGSLRPRRAPSVATPVARDTRTAYPRGRQPRFLTLPPTIGYTCCESVEG